MKTLLTLVRLTLVASAPLLTHCTSTAKKAEAAPLNAAANAKAPTAAKPEAGAPVDDLDEYAVVEIADPIEGLNRATFWLNDKLYLVIFRPLSKGYEAITPKRLRKGIYNAFENVKFPVRFVNHALQGKFKDAGLETEKFVVNTVAGLGGLIRVSEKVPALAALPDQDTGKTFGKWGIGHGAYVVIPFFGPSSVRDGVGLAGDYALNPVNWGVFWSGDHDWTNIPPSANTLRLLPSQLSLYDSTIRDSVDPYIAVRSAYVQNRAEAVKK